MRVLFVHGMGRSPLSGWPMLRRVRKAGFATESFGYMAAIDDVDTIVTRLQHRLHGLAAAGPYAVIGHSLGGVLLRAALQSMAPAERRPERLFLLGSPVTASRLALRLRRNAAFRLLTGDCGQLLGSAERMQQIGPTTVAATGIAGIRGLTGRFSPFGNEANDGVVSVSEVDARWLAHRVQLPVPHTLLPASEQVAHIIVPALVQLRAGAASLPVDTIA